MSKSNTTNKVQVEKEVNKVPFKTQATFVSECIGKGLVVMGVVFLFCSGVQKLIEKVTE